MRIRQVWVSLGITPNLWVTVEEWEQGQYPQRKEREYHPGHHSAERLARLLNNYPVDSIGMSSNRISVMRTFYGIASQGEVPL